MNTALADLDTVGAALPAHAKEHYGSNPSHTVRVLLAAQLGGTADGPTAVPAGALVSQFPVGTIPLPALGEGADRVSGAVGPGGPALGLVPPRPIHQVHQRPPR